MALASSAQTLCMEEVVQAANGRSVSPLLPYDGKTPAACSMRIATSHSSGVRGEAEGSAWYCTVICLVGKIAKT